MITVTPYVSFTYARATINLYRANAGEGLPRHEHTFSHGTVVLAGQVALRKEGLERILTADSKPINLRANEWHEIEALVDGTTFMNLFEAQP